MTRQGQGKEKKYREMRIDEVSAEVKLAEVTVTKAMPVRETL
jgi:hypothetical protein